MNSEQCRPDPGMDGIQVDTVSGLCTSLVLKSQRNDKYYDTCLK